MNKNLMNNKKIRDVCLCLGTIGLAYVVLLMVFMLLTGAKIIKSIMLIATFSSMLFTFGLSDQVRTRLKQQVKIFLNR